MAVALLVLTEESVHSSAIIENIMCKRLYQERDGFVNLISAE